jgi:ribonucleoside-diphosphate reductase alpha chain
MHFEQPISKYIWDSKYRYRWQERVIDQDVEQTWQRVAKAVAKAEAPRDRSYWQQQFLSILDNFQFLPGGRILAGAGTRHQVTLFNCFVMGRIDDSLSGIFRALKEGALTLQQGGGIGFDFSTIRPKGLIAQRTGNVASGPVSFMRIWDAMSATMQSTGARRGAMMGTLRCDHPDIMHFIEAKADPAQLRQFNVSLLVTDEFMRAVKHNRQWELVFPLETIEDQVSNRDCIMRRWSGSSQKIPCVVLDKINARKLWEAIIKAAYQYAEPGVIFEDTVNKNNNLWYREWQSATNPCGEIPLPHYGACNLGSINLTQFISNAFTDHAKIDWPRLQNTALIATRFLDNVIDVSRYPLISQKREALATRRIGLGITGLADALVMLGLHYGSEQATRLARKIMRELYHATNQASIELAKEKHAFPEYNKSAYLQSPMIKRLPDTIKKQLTRHGMRNSHHTAIAPTGTISLLANNISNGLEPIFEAHFHRRVRTASGKSKNFSVHDYAFLHWRKHFDPHSLPSNWVDAQQLKPIDHLNMQAALQPYVDNAISKTIYIPERFPFKQLKAVYQKAYQLKLKGCTIFRPNPITGSVITCCECDERALK